MHNVYMLHSVVPTLDILNKNVLDEREKQLKQLLGQYVEEIRSVIEKWGTCAVCSETEIFMYTLRCFRRVSLAFVFARQVLKRYHV